MPPPGAQVINPSTYCLQETTTPRTWEHPQFNIYFHIQSSIKNKLFLTSIHFWEREGERERVSMSGGGAETEGNRIRSRLQALSCSTESDMGLEPTNCEIVTWAAVGRLTYRATQGPRQSPILNFGDTCMTFKSDLAHFTGLKIWFPPGTTLSKTLHVIRSAEASLGFWDLHQHREKETCFSQAVNLETKYPDFWF